MVTPKRRSLTRLEELSYRINSLARRINPGHSSSYIPGPADAADRAFRDADGAREEMGAVMIEVYRAAWSAWIAGAKFQSINRAASRRLFGLKEIAWDDRGRPCNYILQFDRDMVRQVRADARADFPEVAGLPKAVFADYLEERSHPAARAFRLTKEELL